MIGIRSFIKIKRKHVQFIAIHIIYVIKTKAAGAFWLETYLLLLLLTFFISNIFPYRSNSSGWQEKKNDIQFYSERGKTIELKVAKQYTTI